MVDVGSSAGRETLRALAEAATEPPWTVGEDDGDLYDVPVYDPAGNVLCISPDDGVRGGHELRDARFIAAAREAVPALLALVEQQATQIELLSAKNKEFTDDYVPMVSNDFLTVENGVASLKMHGARKVVATLAESMSLMLDDVKAENYIEMDAIAAGGKKLTLRVQRGEKPTPHALRVAADRRAEAAEAKLKAVKALHQPIRNEDGVMLECSCGDDGSCPTYALIAASEETQ